MDICLFAGGNTATGFVSFYHQLCAQARYTTILKGGPGVGKSTFMREAAQAFRQKGHPVSYYACSGDPDSLDAVMDEITGELIVDGTAPHMLDPKLPGAADSILNLGTCLNEKQLGMQADAIRSLNREIADRYAQAYRYLASAESVLQDAFAVYCMAVSEKHTRSLRSELALQLTRMEEGAGWELFAQAITCKGTLQSLDGILTDQVISLDLPWGLNPHPILEPLRQKAVASGWAHKVYRDPLHAQRIAHLQIGKTLITTAVMMDAPRYELEIDKSVLAQYTGRMSFNRAAYDLMLHQAYDALNEAKKLHDALERLYTDAMDYDQLQSIKQQFLEKLR